VVTIPRSPVIPLTQAQSDLLLVSSLITRALPKDGTVRERYFINEKESDEEGNLSDIYDTVGICEK
jgi:hypothetical protein